MFRMRRYFVFVTTPIPAARAFFLLRRLKGDNSWRCDARGSIFGTKKVGNIHDRRFRDDIDCLKGRWRQRRRACTLARGVFRMHGVVGQHTVGLRRPAYTRGGDGYLSDIIPESMFDEMLPYRNDPRCYAVGFYTYDAFISAAKEFPDFGNTGDDQMRKREIAAFLGQTSHETTGGWATAPDGPYAWGYCYLREINCQDYCDPSSKYQCVAGKQYCGRGPIQLTWNYNYGLCGDDLNLPLLQEPELVETDPVISFRTALWFWMTPQSPKPSCHAVITGSWTSNEVDVEAGRVPGYGVITNIINGGLECGQGGPNDANEDRIGFYKTYCDKLGTTPGPNLDCYQQRPFGYGLLGLKDIM